MRRLVECVPNFSEGRRPEVVEEIAAAISGVPGVFLLDRHVDPSHNRSVLTFVGGPDDVREAAFRAIEKASQLIDMTRHRGVHPRIGAADVVPFVPLRNATMAECVHLAEELGREVAERLDIPVFLYEHAAKRKERRLLADVRRGEFEGLREEILANPDRAPDMGPARLHPTAGATAIGARHFLIAFNVNLAAGGLAAAREIARRVREKGGGFAGVRALGFELEDGRAQVSMNLVDFRRTGPYEALVRVTELARELGVEVLGSELVGLVPEDAVYATAGAALRIPSFERERVVEERLRRLVAPVDLHDFLDDLSSTHPSPGGGSAAALAGALGAASAGKVAALALSKARRLASAAGAAGPSSDAAGELDRLGRALHAARFDFLKLVERDAAAYAAVVAASRLPRSTPEAKARRESALEAATIEACRAPIAVAETAASVVEAAWSLALRGKKTLLADIVAAAALVRAATDASHAMLRVNVPALGGKPIAGELRSAFDAARRRVHDAAQAIDEAFEGSFEPPGGGETEC